MVCRHADDDRSNCHLANLSWGTQRENLLDGVRNRGGASKKLSPEKLLRIRRLKSIGTSNHRIALSVGISTTNVTRILSHRQGT